MLDVKYDAVIGLHFAFDMVLLEENYEALFGLHLELD